MYRSSANRLYASMVSVGAGFLLTGTSLFASEKPAQVQSQSQGPTVISASRRGVSAPMRDYKVVGPIAPGPNRVIRNELNIPKKTSLSGAQDPIVQSLPGISQPAPLNDWEGGSDDQNATVVGFRVVPPDTNGDVGIAHYVQFINLIWTVWDKSGNVLLGPLPGNSPYAGFGGPCETTNDGDPVAKYDRFADRWVLTQFAVPNFPDGPSYQCFAVSQTGDPTGAYNLYEFTIGSLPGGWGDYPKLGIWPDGYYICYNMFTSSAFVGMGNFAFDRTNMLTGAPATAISFINPSDGGGLPSDLDGPTPPAVGTPNYFLTWWDPVVGTLNIYEFHVDFATPGNSTFTGPIEFGSTPYVIPPCPGTYTCVPQLGGELLDTLGDRLMNRLVYRNYGTHESLVTNQTVDAGGRTGLRWWEVRDPGGTPTVYQAATYAPDSVYRWMGSIAQDIDGNMALGYSLSDATMNPAIGITGRLAGDPLNTMGAEDVWFAGTGSQIGSFNRWGDYSSMSIDPVDDCTFWYTQEYYANTEAFDFKTRIGSFKFPSCVSGASGTLEGTVTDGTNPIEGATVTAGAFSTTTNVAGNYTFFLPVGTYDMTVTKYGFLPGSANDVPVTDGGDTVQDFTLLPAPQVLVNGIVRDASGGNWPLYAKIVITGPGAPTFTIFTDPVTGYYSQTLVTGITYNFAVTAVSPGYNPGGGSLPLLVAAPIVQNWDLFADLASCIAPGYSTGTPGTLLNESFDGGVLPPGWSVINNSGNGAGWLVQTDFAPCFEINGNPTGGTGAFALVNSDCDGFVTVDAEIRTLSFDVSAFNGATLQFNQEYFNLGDTADVDLSTDGGATWGNVLRQTSSDRGPAVATATLTGAGGQADVRLRFHYYNAFFAWWWAVDNVLVTGANCQAQPGGLVVGNVRDGNTNAGINGATVDNLTSGGSATTFATPQDPNQDDGFYILFSESGPESFEASATNYQSQTKSTSVIPNSAIRIDFSLAAGVIDASPRPMNSKINPGTTDLQTLTLTNTGGADGDFHIRELNVPAQPALHRGPYADPKKIKEALARIPKRFAQQAYQNGMLSAKGLAPSPDAPKNTRPLVAGDVLATYSATFASPAGLPYGVMYNKGANDFWISNLDSGFPGDNMDYQFLADGTQTGATIDMSSLGFLPVDGTFNDITGMFWQATNDFFGFSNTCIYEIDPAAQAMTGNTICPAFPTPQTGLAYNVLTNTYYSGSFFDFVINHFDSNGVILDSVNTGLNISGLAFNRSTGHLFVFNQDVGSGPTDDVYVLDPSNGYAVLGSFVVGPPGINQFAGGGMEMDCNGHLIMVDQLGGNPILVVDSGEGTECGFVDTIPWVSENPTDGTVPAGGSVPVAVTFDSAGLRPGLRQAQLTIGTDTPTPVAPVPLNFTVRFLDVLDNVPPGTNTFENFIYGAAGAGIMAGSPYPGCQPGLLDYFCPSGLVTRADMAGYIWRSVHGPFFPPPVYTGIFSDVLFNDYNADYIQGVYNDGITVGCQAPGDPLAYCPNQSIPRAQMAVFIEKGVRGSGFVPDPCTQPPIFDDVPCPATPAFPYSDWVEVLFIDGITAGCSVSPPLFCPLQAIPNEQMAVFIVKAFGFPVLP